MKKGYQVLALFCLLFGVQDSKSLLTDEIFPNVNDAIETEASKLTGLINEKDAKVETLEKRMAQEFKGLVQKVTGLERSISSKDTENAQLNVSHHLLCNFLHGN